MPLIDVGRAAPEFSLKDQAGKTHRLSDYRGRTVVLYFYPEDDTPLCTAQACQFRDHHPDFTKIKSVVLGVSPQDSASHARFAAMHALPFTLLADGAPAGGGPAVCERFGVWREKTMYGKKVTGMVRTTYLIGPDGKVARRWDAVKTPGHAARVLEAVRALHRGEKLSVLGTPRVIKKAKPARQKTRTQGGHPGYSGVAGSKGKKTRERTAGLKERGAGRPAGARGR